jgi:hypothetical protein
MTEALSKDVCLEKSGMQQGRVEEVHMPMI